MFTREIYSIRHYMLHADGFLVSHACSLEFAAMARCLSRHYHYDEATMPPRVVGHERAAAFAYFIAASR